MNTCKQLDHILKSKRPINDVRSYFDSDNFHISPQKLKAGESVEQDGTPTFFSTKEREPDIPEENILQTVPQ